MPEELHKTQVPWIKKRKKHYKNQIKETQNCQHRDNKIFPNNIETAPNSSINTDVDEQIENSISI